MLDAGGGGSCKNGYQIYQEVHPDTQFAGALQSGASGVKDAAREHDLAAIELAGVIESLNDSWRGDAAEAAKRELKVLEKVSGDVGGQNLNPAESSMGTQSASHTGTRHRLVEMPPNPEDANAVAEFFGFASQEENNEEWARKNRQNISTYSSYQTSTFANNAPLRQEFPEIPSSGEKDGGDDETGGGRTGGGGGGGGTWNPPPGGTGGTTPSYSGGGGGSGGSGGGGTTVPSVNTPGGGGIGGGGGLPDGGGVRLPDGSIRMPDGSIRKPDGTIVKPDGTIIRPDGTIVRPDGTVIPPGNTSASGLGSGGRDGAAGAGFVPAGGAGGAGGFGPGGGGAGGFGPTGGGAAAGAAGGGLGAGKGVGSMAPGAGSGAGAGGAMGKGGMGGGMGGRGGMGGMMGGAGAGRGQGGGEEKEHKDQYFIKQEMDPGLHVEHDEHGEKLVDETTGLTVVPPVIGE